MCVRECVATPRPQRPSLRCSCPVSRHATTCCHSDHLFHLNYAITLYNNDETERALAHFSEFEALFAVRRTHTLAMRAWRGRACHRAHSHALLTLCAGAG